MVRSGHLTNLEHERPFGICLIDVEGAGKPLEDGEVDVGQVPAAHPGEHILTVASIALICTLHHLPQSLSNVGCPALEHGISSLHAGVPPESLRLNEINLYRHHIGKVLTVRGRHVEHPPVDRQPPEVALGCEDAAVLVQVEAGVRVAGHHPVADHVAGVEVQGGQGDDLTPQGHRAGHSAGAGLSFELKQKICYRNVTQG